MKQKTRTLGSISLEAIDLPVGILSFVKIRLQDDHPVAICPHGHQNTLILLQAQSEETHWHRGYTTRQANSIAVDSTLDWHTPLPFLTLQSDCIQTYPCSCYIQYIQLQCHHNQRPNDLGSTTNNIPPLLLRQYFPLTCREVPGQPWCAWSAWCCSPHDCSSQSPVRAPTWSSWTCWEDCNPCGRPEQHEATSWPQITQWIAPKTDKIPPPLLFPLLP